MATSWLDLLPDKISALDKNTFDTPRRTPLLNQGGAPPGIMRVSPRELRRFMQAQQLMLVRDADRFFTGVTVPFVISAAGVAGAQLVVNAAEASRPRALLVIRNASTSAGTVFVGLGGGADINNAFVALAAGQSLVLDTGIPQNDIFISADTATPGAPTFGAATYGISRAGG